MGIVSVSEAAKLVRKGRQTLYDHRDKGKLSFTEDAEGKTGIDVSELARVYGKLYATPGMIEADKARTDSGRSDSAVQAKPGRSDNSVQMNMNTDVYERQLEWFQEMLEKKEKQLAEKDRLLIEQMEKYQQKYEDWAIQKENFQQLLLPSPEPKRRRFLGIF